MQGSLDFAPLLVGLSRAALTGCDVAGMPALDLVDGNNVAIRTTEHWNEEVFPDLSSAARRFS
jgi:hypothetical protein